jgi:hypothetical protein
MFASQRPGRDFVPDPGTEPVGGDYSFHEERKTMDTTGGEDYVRPSKEYDEEDKNNLFKEEDDLEGARLSLILADAIRHIDDPPSPCNRYTEMTRLWTVELLRTVEARPSICFATSFRYHRVQLSQRPPSNSVRSDLTDFSLGVERVRIWRNNLHGTISRKDCRRWILTCDALACKLSVEVTAGGLTEIDVSDVHFDCDWFNSLLASRKGFRDFVKTHWDRVLHAVFVFQVQPLDPDL